MSVVFFFSSRRRHTRWPRDWSSDVCSSDLAVLKAWETPFAIDQPPMSHRAPMRSYLRDPRGLLPDLAHRWPNPILATVRSEERRVGKECRCRWSTSAENMKLEN